MPVIKQVNRQEKSSIQQTLEYHRQLYNTNPQNTSKKRQRPTETKTINNKIKVAK